jgi:hypothetical protein
MFLRDFPFPTLAGGNKEGLKTGRKEGRQEEREQLILGQLRKRFGALEPECEARIGQCSFEQLGELGEALMDFAARRDLTNRERGQAPTAGTKIWRIWTICLNGAAGASRTPASA